MGKINVLQPNVFNMLAAGEVVENPASVVKELVENSLDAGATEIDINVEQGGIRKIQVSDNGIGILKEDMRTAFVPHATSKINSVDDLDSLATLGFRGEALASIASVSEVTLVSASKSQNTSSKLVLSGGNVTYEGSDSRARGTIITVENLFFNTPARLKFLKKPPNEMRAVLDTVRMLVLANPHVSFTLANEDEELLRHECGSLKDAICAVYGVKTVDKMLEVTPSDGTIKVSGYVSATDFTKPNRIYQTIIVNGRAVEDALIQTAVEKAYGDYLMKRAYPMFVLDIVLPFDEVDVNVHPRKSEVRFYDKQKVFGAVYHAVQDAVNASVGKSKLGFNISTDAQSNITSSVSELPDASANTSIDKNADNHADKSDFNVNTGVQARIDTSALYVGKSAPKDLSFALSGGKFGGFRQSSINLFDTDKSATNTDNSANSDLPIVNQNLQNSEVLYHNDAENSEIPDIGVFDGKIIGQIFATYLLVERDDKLYVIDQHAAHERILYDKIAEKCKPEYSQPLLIPYKLSLTGSEEEYIEKILPTLNTLGFEIEHQKYTYFVKAVPSPVADINFGKFFVELFSNMLSENELTLAGLLKEKLCQQACKAAIKGGDVLTRAQIEQVIKNYVDEDGNLPSKCPHGRPAAIALDKRDFEKMFKRIV